MGNTVYKNLTGIIALLLVGFALFGCIGQPAVPAQLPAQVPVPTVCGKDLQTCPDGTQVARNPANDCQFIACPQPLVCTMEAKLCSDGSFVSRNWSRNCAFNPCPVVTNSTLNASNLAPVGASCAGAAGIKCQVGLQCIISGQPNADGTCTTPAPALQSMKQCPNERYSNCTNDISPVCGKAVTAQAAFRDYNNACEACSTSSNAIGYYAGTCENQ